MYYPCILNTFSLVMIDTIDHHFAYSGGYWCSLVLVQKLLSTHICSHENRSENRFDDDK